MRSKIFEHLARRLRRIDLSLFNAISDRVESLSYDLRAHDYDVFVFNLHRYERNRLANGSDKASDAFFDLLQVSGYRPFQISVVLDETKGFKKALVNVVFQGLLIHRLKAQHSKLPSAFIYDVPGSVGKTALLMRLIFPAFRYLSREHNEELAHRLQRIYFCLAEGQRRKALSLFRIYVNTVVSEICSFFAIQGVFCISRQSKLRSQISSLVFRTPLHYVPYVVDASEIADTKEHKPTPAPRQTFYILRQGDKGNIQSFQTSDELVSEGYGFMYLGSEETPDGIEHYDLDHIANIPSCAAGIIILDEWGLGFKTKVLDCIQQAPVYFLSRSMQARYDSMFPGAIFVYCSQLGKNEVQRNLQIFGEVCFTDFVENMKLQASKGLQNGLLG